MKIQIPESEMEFIFSRSSGVGGQNVNKVNTKVTARWNLQNSKIFNDEQKAKLAQKLKNRLDTKGDLIIYSQESRSQYQNKESVIEKLNKLINKSLIEKPNRVSTKPTRVSKEKRIQEKKIVSQKKKLRIQIKEV